MDRTDASSQEKLRRHLSLFTDKADTEQIFARVFEGRDSATVKRMLDVFLGSTILYDLALQWILADGPFQYDFSSLTGRKDNADIENWAKSGFAQVFGHPPEDFELVGKPPKTQP